MELSPSWEAANCAATQEIPSILWDTKVHYRVHKSPTLVPFLNQTNPIYMIPYYLSRIHFNIVHPSTSSSSQWMHGGYRRLMKKRRHLFQDTDCPKMKVTEMKKTEFNWNFICKVNISDIILLLLWTIVFRMSTLACYYVFHVPKIRTFNFLNSVISLLVHSLISPIFSWTPARSHENFHADDNCPSRHSNRAPPEYKSLSKCIRFFLHTVLLLYT
jgi:hypothetical protein